MALFSSKPPIVLPPTTGIHVSRELLESLPDPGEILMDIYRRFPFPDQIYEDVAAELNRVRFPGGDYDLRNEKYDKKSGPLGLLCWITAPDWIAVQVWARGDLGRSQKKEVENIVADLCRNQGVPAAASWTLQAWASSNQPAPRLDSLAHLLSETYNEQLDGITNGMVSDSIKKWKRENLRSTI